MKKNKIIKCQVTGFKDYGVFVKCEDDYDGLIHISELSYQYVEETSNIFDVNDKLTLKVLDVDKDNKKLKLSYKRCHKSHRRILRNVKMLKGFNKLSNNLNNWIKIKLKEYNYDKRNNN